jgi:hypothetical protein
MQPATSFSEILEAADNLSPEEQQVLIDILNRRMIERRRSQLLKDVHDANQEFQRGEARPTDLDSLMREIDS